MNFISVVGYGWSGSSAYMDLLQEFDDIDVFPGEFRLAKDPHGLIDLENSLVDNWEFIRHDVAIREFKSYCEMLSRETGVFKRAGKDFSRKLNIDFIETTNKFIDGLTDISYLGDSSLHRYNINAMEYFYKRLRTKFSAYSHNNTKMHLAKPSREKFIIESREYINNLFSEFCKRKKVDTIVLDQAVPITNIHKGAAYFENMKVIVVDRDPRDIYANLAKRNSLIGPDIHKNDSAKKYIKWHLKLRESFNLTHEEPNILRVSFEDLVYDYENIVSKISKFLGCKQSIALKREFFNPEYSKKNIGLWKTYKNQDTMNYINKELKEYCYNVE